MGEEQDDSSRTSISCCTWENTVQECSTGWDLPSWGADLWKGTCGSLWKTSSIWVNGVLLRQREPYRMLDCISEGINSTDKELILSLQPVSLSAACQPHLESWTGYIQTLGSREGLQRWLKDKEAYHMKKVWGNRVCPALSKEGLVETLSQCSSI